MSISTGRRAHGGYIPMKARLWERDHYTASWSPEHPATDGWAWMDILWQMDRLELMSERELCVHLGWPRRRLRRFLEEMADAHRVWGLPFQLPRRAGEEVSGDGEAQMPRPAAQATQGGARRPRRASSSTSPERTAQEPAAAPREERESDPEANQDRTRIGPGPNQDRTTDEPGNPAERTSRPPTNAENTPAVGPKPDQNRTTNEPETDHSRAGAPPRVDHPSTRTPTSTPTTETPPLPPAGRGAGALDEQHPPPPPPRTGGRGFTTQTQVEVEGPTVPERSAAGGPLERAVRSAASPETGAPPVSPTAPRPARRPRSKGGEPWRPASRDVAPYDPEDFVGLVSDVVLTVTGRPWDPYRGETTARLVRSHWHHLGRPELAEYLRQVELVAAACRDCGEGIFRNDVRGVRLDGVRWGEDRSRSMGTVLRQRPQAGSGGATWEERVRVAEEWDAVGRPLDTGPQPGRTNRGVYRTDTEHHGDDDALEAF